MDNLLFANLSLLETTISFEKESVSRQIYSIREGEIYVLELIVL